jgi:hypothetical protein
MQQPTSYKRLLSILEEGTDGKTLVDGEEGACGVVVVAAEAPAPALLAVVIKAGCSDNDGDLGEVVLSKEEVDDDFAGDEDQRTEDGTKKVDDRFVDDDDVDDDVDDDAIVVAVTVGDTMVGGDIAEAVAAAS